MMRNLALCFFTFFGGDGGDESTSGGGRVLTLRFQSLRASLVMVVAVW